MVVMTDRLCSQCNKTWSLPHTYGYETETEKLNWLCGDCFFKKGSPVDIAREVFGIEEENAELLCNLSNQITQQPLEELQKLKDYYLNEKDDYYKPLTEKQKEEIAKETDKSILEAFVRKIIEENDRSKELIKNNIYSLKDWKYKTGWSVFFISTLTSIYYIRNYAKALKAKQSKNLKEEIRDKFNLWRLNMGLSVLFYAVSFYLLQQFINKYIRPNIKWCLENWENTTILFVTGILGILFLIDSYISSELKTPLQRLAIKIENSNIDEEEKKELLSKTQWSNENFKETLKRFGLLTIAGALIKLLERAFDEKFIANFCYAIPIAFGAWQIWRIEKKIKKSRIN